jgi:hypothetical protein
VPQNRAPGQHVDVASMQASPGPQQSWALPGSPHRAFWLQHVPSTQVAPVWQHWVPQGSVPDGHWAHLPLTQLPLQHSLPVVQEVSFGRHEEVVVDVEVVLVGVVVEVLVDVLVEVVLVEVLVVLLVDVLVEVVLVVVVVVPHGPRRSPWSRWLATARWETSMVFSSGVPGLWQMVTFCC